MGGISQYNYCVTTFDYPKLQISLGTFKHARYGCLNIRTGILDFKYTDSKYDNGHLNIQTELVFHTTSGAAWSGPPSRYSNAVTILLLPYPSISYGGWEKSCTS